MLTRVLCGFPLVDDGSVMCRNTAPCPIHRDRRVGDLPAGAPTSEGDGSFDDVAATGSDEAYAAALAAREPAPGLHATITGTELPGFAELRERYGDPADLKPIPGPPVAPEVNFRDMLRDDPGAIMLRDRLSRVLQRPYLATQLVQDLPRETAARLADRLETLVKQAVEVATAEISTAVTHEVVSAMERLDAEAAAKLEEVRRERFTTPSRLA